MTFNCDGYSSELDVEDIPVFELLHLHTIA